MLAEPSCYEIWQLGAVQGSDAAAAARVIETVELTHLKVSPSKLCVWVTCC